MTMLYKTMVGVSSVQYYNFPMNRGLLLDFFTLSSYCKQRKTFIFTNEAYGLSIYQQYCKKQIETLKNVHQRIHSTLTYLGI